MSRERNDLLQRIAKLVDLMYRAKRKVPTTLYISPELAEIIGRPPQFWVGNRLIELHMNTNRSGESLAVGSAGPVHQLLP